MGVAIGVGTAFKLDDAEHFKGVLENLGKLGRKGFERLEVKQEGPNSYAKRFYLDVRSSSGFWEGFVRFISFGWKPQSLRLKEVSKFALEYLVNNVAQGGQFVEICLNNKMALEKLRYTLTRGGQEEGYDGFMKKIFNQEAKNIKALEEARKQYERRANDIRYACPIDIPSIDTQTAMDLLVDTTPPDVTIECKDGVFETLWGLLKQCLRYCNIDKIKTISLKEFPEKIVKAAVGVMKNGDLKATYSIEEATLLFELAAHVRHEHLIDTSAKALLNWITREGTDWFFKNYATLFGHLPIPSKFHDYVIEYLAANLSSFIRHKDFKNFPANIIYPLFASKNLFIQSEDVAYGAIVAWAEHNKGTEMLSDVLRKEVSGISLFNLIRENNLSPENKRDFLTLVRSASYNDKTDKSSLLVRGLQSQFNLDTGLLTFKFASLKDLLKEEYSSPEPRELQFKAQCWNQILDVTLKIADGKVTMLGNEGCTPVHYDGSSKIFAEGTSITCTLSEKLEASFKFSKPPVATGSKTLTGLELSSLADMMEAGARSSTSSSDERSETSSNLSSDGYVAVGTPSTTSSIPLKQAAAAAAAAAGSASKSSKRLPK